MRLVPPVEYLGVAVTAAVSSVGDLDSLGELVKRQPARRQIIPKGGVVLGLLMFVGARDGRSLSSARCENLDIE